MYNQSPYNNDKYIGDNKQYTRNVPPIYNTSLITAVNHVEQGLSMANVIMGGKGGYNADEYGLFKKSDSYSFNMWISKRYTIGEPFNFLSAEIPLTNDLVTDMIIIPVLNFDDGERLVAGTEIELRNYPDAPSHIDLTPYTFKSDVHGDRNFALEFHFRGIGLIGISIPIVINIETEELG